jgi:hypothetical protein
MITDRTNALRKLIESEFRTQEVFNVTPKRVIKRNRCQCNVCKEIIESKYRHDFKSCSCGQIFTDGGIDYIRRGCKDPSDIIDLSEYEDLGLDKTKV